MGSTFSGIELGKRSLLYHQTGLDVIGHNLSNHNVDGYSRQRIKPTTVEPLYEPSLNRAERAGQIGQGVETAAIRRDRDLYIDTRILTEMSKREHWSNRSDLLIQVENIHNALDDINLQQRLDRFWSGWQALIGNPSEPAVRESLIKNAESLTMGFNDAFRKFDRLRYELDEKVENKVRQINDYAKALAGINTRILQSEAMEDNPNDLKDKRDRMAEELSRLVGITINHKDNDEIMIFLEGKVLVQGTEHALLETRPNPQNNGLKDIYFTQSADRYLPQAGSLRSDLEIRDAVLSDQIRRINALAINVAESVNEIHREGFDLFDRNGEDFFSIAHYGTDPLGNVDRDGDGLLDGTYLYQVRGGERLDGKDIVGSVGTLTLAGPQGPVFINYQEEERIEDLLTRINASEADVNAYLNAEGRLVFKARSFASEFPFAIGRIEDSGRFLVGTAGMLNASGAAGAYDANALNAYAQLAQGMAGARRSPARNPAGWIQVNASILKDSSKVAAAGGTDYDGIEGKERSFGVGDGTTAAQIADLRFSDWFIDDKVSLNDYYVSMVADIGGLGQSAQTEKTKYQAIVDNLIELRQSISGVNIDEEMTNMIAMQHGYQAGARIVTVMDDMLDTIINRMGI